MWKRLHTSAQGHDNPDAARLVPCYDLRRSEIREATSSMTSVPKPLKFLRPHYEGMKEFFADMMDSENKTTFSEVLSVLGMTMAGYDICCVGALT